METLKKIATWKTIVPALVLYLAFSLGAFPYYQTKVDELADEKIKALDLRLAYTLEDVERSFAKMGTEGRAITSFISGRIDMVYPMVYGCFLILLITNLSKDTIPRRFYLLLIGPLLGMLFDYLENFQVLNMLMQFPEITEKQVQTSSLMTSIKWLFILMSLAIVLVLGLLKVGKFIRRKNAE